MVPDVEESVVAQRLHQLRLVHLRPTVYSYLARTLAQLVDGPVLVGAGLAALAADGRPGEVLGLRPEGLTIACAGGAIAFAELQLPGRRRMPAAAVLAGHRIPAGTVLA